MVGGGRVSQINSSVVSSSTHGVSDAFLDSLEKLAHQDQSWWRDVLLRDDVMLAVRHKSLNVYHRGGSIFRIKDWGNRAVPPKTHVKYLVRQQQVYAELVDGEFKPGPNAFSWSRYEGPTTLDDMIRSAAALAGPEKTGLHALVIGSPKKVIDVEVSLERADDAEPSEGPVGQDEPASKTKPVHGQDRLDVATLERRKDGIYVVFHEAKHFSNSGLRSKSGTPAVVKQIRRYRNTIKLHAPDLAQRYQAVCRALVRLDAMRRAVRNVARSGLDPLILEVANGVVDLQVDSNPRLIVFGFDGDQKKGLLNSYLDKLCKAEPKLHIYPVGDPASARGAFLQNRGFRRARDSK